MSLNKVFIIGNITRDIEIRHTTKGTAVANLPIAVNESVKQDNGEYKDYTTYLDVVVWGKRAENCAEYLSKGSMVFVEGKLQNNNFTDQSGKKVYKLELKADKVDFLSTHKKETATKEEKKSFTPPEAHNYDSEVPF